MIPQSILDFFHAGKSLPFRSMTFFNFLLEATLAGSVLIVVVMVLRQVFRKRIGSRMVYVAWALVAIRLLLPIAIPNPLMDGLRPTYSSDMGARPIADQVRIRYQDAMAAVSYRLSTAAYEGNSPFQQGLATVAQELNTYTSYGWLGKAYLLCYAVGVLGVAAVFAARHLRFRRRLLQNAVSPLEGQQLALYQSLCKELGVKPIPVWYVDPLTSPCLVGVCKPLIALPLTLPQGSLSEALLHELSHYQTRDSWWVLLRCACCAVHWFNPLVWVAQRLVRTDCELACDERIALRLTPEERMHYADTLIRTARQAYTPRAGVITTGMTMTGKRLMRRVNAILHLKTVQRVAATLVAAVLLVLSLAAFSTAETNTLHARIASDTSAFPFLPNDAYPPPDNVFSEVVALTPLTDAAQARAQAIRYLCALYPWDQLYFETQYQYRVQQFGKTGWEVVAWPPESSNWAAYYMELKSAGALVSVTRTDIAFANGDEHNNSPSVLPNNLVDVLLIYGQRISAAALQNVAVDKAAIHADTETAAGRYVVCDLSNTQDDTIRVSLSAQIAPEFCLTGIYNAADFAGTAVQANPPIERRAQQLVYGKDAAIAFNAVFWGDTDSQYALTSNVALTVQQAFDMAVDTMLEKSGLAREAFLAMPLEYGYYDKANFDGDTGVWRFEWYVDRTEPMNRYWVELQDMATPAYINLSAPGEGLG